MNSEESSEEVIKYLQKKNEYSEEKLNEKFRKGKGTSY